MFLEIIKQLGNATTEEEIKAVDQVISKYKWSTEELNAINNLMARIIIAKQKKESDERRH